MERGEWSGAIVRAATATEIAANFVVREELVKARGLESEFVDHLLKWANGLQGKFDRLILPVTKAEKHHGAFKKLRASADELNKERNHIVHIGGFKQESTARKMIHNAHELICGLVKPYRKKFVLENILQN